MNIVYLLGIDPSVLGRLAADVLLASPVFALIAVYFIVRKARRNRKLQQRQKEVTERIIELITKHIPIKLICGEAPALPFSEGEELLSVFAQTTLFEARAVRDWVGSHGGSSFRVARGVYLHAGASTGRSESHDEMRALDRGTLLVTNNRLMFVGPNRTIDAPLHKIINIDTESYSDWLRVNIQGKERTVCFLLNIDLPMLYEYRGEMCLAPLDAKYVKAAIEQQMGFQRFPLYGAYHPTSEVPAPITNKV